jgi:hypothetical protein
MVTNLALEKGLIPGAITKRLPPPEQGFQSFETTELDNLNQAKNYALTKITRGEEFIIPITMSVGGGGHTVYIVGAKQGNEYHTTILNQTEHVPPEALAELQNISRTITTAINNDLISSGLRTSIRQSEPAAINGVFPSRGGGAGCQEVGVVLVDAIRNGNLKEVVSHCKNITLDSMKLAEVRLKATLAHEQIESRKDGLSIDERVAQSTQGEV